MTYFGHIYDMEPAKRDEFLNWVREQNLDPTAIADDGRFSVHEGHVSGFEFLTDGEGQSLVYRDEFIKKPFNVEQKTPLPEGF